MARLERTIGSPIGELTLVADELGLVRVLFAGQGPDSDALGTGDVADDVTDDGSIAQVLDETERQLGEYFAGERTEFDLPLHLDGTEFQRAAWMALAEIPYGSTTSYARQAEAIGRPGAFRAVGAANGQNPIPIVLPCHRIIGADGSLTGFGGGLDVKAQLLDLECAQQSLPF